MVATGQPPKPVDEIASEWTTIPPAFTPFVQDVRGGVSGLLAIPEGAAHTNTLIASDVVMSVEVR